MKHFLTAIACCLAVAGSAQTPIPYNPDSDGDGIVGTEDLLVFLSEFGTSYTPLTFTDEAVNVLVNESNEFEIHELSPLYIIDLRGIEATEVFGYVDIEDEAGIFHLYPMQGAEFWFIAENASSVQNVHFFADGPSLYIQEEGTDGYCQSWFSATVNNLTTGYTYAGDQHCSCCGGSSEISVVKRYMWYNNGLMRLN